MISKSNNENISNGENLLPKENNEPSDSLQKNIIPSKEGKHQF
jgi:hypothetical protein